MDIKTFERIVCTRDISDKQVGDTFNLLVIETSTDNAVIVRALELLGRYRQELTGKIFKVIVSCAPKEQLEKAFYLLTQEEAMQLAITAIPGDKIYTP